MVQMRGDGGRRSNGWRGFVGRAAQNVPPEPSLLPEIRLREPAGCGGQGTDLKVLKQVISPPFMSLLNISISLKHHECPEHGKRQYSLV